MSSGPNKRRTGIWLVGINGGLATTVVAGVHMIRRGLVSTCGLLTETPVMTDLDLAPLDGLVFGGHDIRRAGVYESALEIYRETRTIDLEKLQAVEDDLRAVDEDVRVGTSLNCGTVVRRMGVREADRPGETPMALAQRLAADITEFRERRGLDDVVVVNLASTEPPMVLDEDFATAKGVRKLLERGPRGRTRASLLYGYAAVVAGCPFINFTPNEASLAPGVQRMARSRGIPVMGNDGKTGETLVKSALAPMFKYRNLQVLTWQGYNILGDRDGQVLADTRHKRAKVHSKDSVLSAILGYPLHTHVGIDYVPSLSDLKTAWDFIHFQGFLDYKMSMQFTWQGCDAILAAPLVLDMARLAELGRRLGERALLTHLACFFKRPLGVDEQDLHFQFHHLMDYVAARSQGRDWPTGVVAGPGEVKLPEGPKGQGGGTRA